MVLWRDARQVTQCINQETCMSVFRPADRIVDSPTGTVVTVLLQSAGYSWACEDGLSPAEGTIIATIVCPVSCYRYCPTPPSQQPCNQAIWNSEYCIWDTSRCQIAGECRVCTPIEVRPGNNSAAVDGEATLLDEPDREENPCCRTTPIVIDILGNGYNLTNAQNGVEFDFNGDGVSHRISWTSAGSDDAWLVLDRNGNGTIDSGEELFGNMTPQPDVEVRHGFLALAEYDKVANGGDENGKINHRDDVFPSLRLWQDTNHNGVSESSELHTLPELGLSTLDLDYRESRRTDEHGNQFKYRAKVRDAEGAQLGRWAWDVFLVLDGE